MFKKSHALAPSFMFSLGTLCVGAAVGCTDALVADKMGVGTGKFGDPVQLRRDNPAIGGVVEVSGNQVKGTVGSDRTSYSEAKWTNALGYLQISEYRSNYSLFASYKTPLVPTADFQSPGTAHFGTRAIPLVHGNFYEISAVGMGTDNQTHYDSWLAELSDEIAVVPVVLVHWQRGRTTAADSAFKSGVAGAMDFYPALAKYADRPAAGGHPLALHLKTPTIDQLAITTATQGTWSEGWSKYRPFGRWTPPDELFAKCGVQFQVVDEVTFRLPENWIAGAPENCSEHGENTPNAGWAYLDQLGNSALAQYVVRKLQPIWINFADFRCSKWHGVTAKGTGIVDMERDAPSRMIAHELGHVLGLEHADSRAINLMHPGANSDTLTEDTQCPAVRNVARQYSARFDEYNRVTGRTFSRTPPNLEAETASTDPNTGGDFGELGGDAGICCSAFPAGTNVSVEQCAAAGGHEVDCPEPEVPR